MTYFLYQMCDRSDFAPGPTYEIVVVSNPDTDDTKNILATTRKHYASNGVILFRTNEETTETLAVIKLVAYYRPIGRKATAYVCQNQTFKQPTSNVDKLIELLDT